MYVGIYYEIKRKEVNRQLQNLDSAVIMSGYTSYYFTNPILALSVKQYLNRNNINFKYDLVHLSKEKVQGKTLIKSYEQFLEYTQQAIENIKEMGE